MADPATERTLWKACTSLRKFWATYAACALLVLVQPAVYVWGLPVQVGFTFLGIAGAAVLACWINSKKRTYVLTDQRIIGFTGLLARERVEIELSDIRQMTLKQGLLQRVLGAGDIEIESAGGSEVELRLEWVAAPNDVMETVRNARLTSPRVPPPFPAASIHPGT